MVADGRVDLDRAQELAEQIPQSKDFEPSECALIDCQQSIALSLVDIAQSLRKLVESR